MFYIQARSFNVMLFYIHSFIFTAGFSLEDIIQ